MKNLLLAIFSLFIAGAAWAQGVRPEHSGAWYNPNQSGHGLSVEVIAPDRAVAYWHAFDPLGDPLWLYIDGQIDGNVIRGEAYTVEGMTWGVFDPGTRNVQPWGTVDIAFTGCHSAELSWNSLFPDYGEGQLPLARLTAIHGLACHDETDALLGYYDVLWTETESGATHSGTAIIDGTGFLTVAFEDPEWDYMNMHGNVSAISGDWTGQVSMAVRLAVSPVEWVRDLELSGTYSFGLWPVITVENEGNVFVFTMSRERLGSGPVSPGDLEGPWRLKFAGVSYDVEVDQDGGFEWTVTGYLGTWAYRAHLETLPEGPPIIPVSLEVATWGGQTLTPMRGHAIYYFDPDAGPYSNEKYLEMRVTDDSGGLFWVMELERFDP
ncbi:MAG: hypothetical protein P8Y52_01550 [Xanthomonadales bacterium]